MKGIIFHRYMISHAGVIRRITEENKSVRKGCVVDQLMMFPVVLWIVFIKVLNTTEKSLLNEMKVCVLKLVNSLLYFCN